MDFNEAVDELRSNAPNLTQIVAIAAGVVGRRSLAVFP
jgi:hypothetical protein